MSERLDVAMVAKGLAQSREKARALIAAASSYVPAREARALIMAGVVYVEGARADKAGMPVGDAVSIEVRENPIPFVSRGGLKLQKALEVFPIRLEGVTAADIGASTGGFTDCMLQHGAKHVYSIDVGYGQLDWSLRNDPRVTVMERTNARYMEEEWFQEAPSFASIDVSFISLQLMLPPLYDCLTENGEIVALIKPQFEAGRSEVGKNGVVRDAKVHADVCRRMVDFALATGYHVRGLSYSPITGPKGNIEFLLYITKEPNLTANMQNNLSIKMNLNQSALR